MQIPSLYVHVPFCLKKCAYCAFYSLPLSCFPEAINSFLQGISQEIECRRIKAPQGVFSLFLGGGTPTALSAEELDFLLGLIHKNFTFGSQAPEKTVEANPGTITADKLTVLRFYGINRISLGAQSFHDQMLQRIGRIHTASDIRSAVKLIRQAGIKNLNLDLIFGLPGQTIADWQDTLKQAVEMEPEHLSVYALTLEEDTPFGRIYLADHKKDDCALIPDDDLQADMYELAGGYLRDMGYIHYEISNFARPGYECHHNQAYWSGEDYLGLGPGAVSCLDGVRTKNREDIYLYQQMTSSGQMAFDPAETEILSLEQKVFEAMMLGLRTAAGIDFAVFEHKFHRPLQDIYGQILVKYMDREILFIRDGCLRLQEKYFFIANVVLQEFILPKNFLNSP